VLTTYWKVANSGVVWILVSIGLAYVAYIALAFFLKARKRCVALGIDPGKVSKVVSSTIPFMIVPALAMLIGFLTLASALGTPLSWFRLSVVGATTYELMAADTVSSSMGFENLVAARGEDGSIFVAVMFVMAVGILGGIITNAIFCKKITTTLTSYTQKNAAWGVVFTGSFLISMIAVFLPSQLIKGPVAIATTVTGAAITFCFSMLSKKFSIKWLDDFILSFSMIGAMASSLLWESLFA
jgi:hypothetical protein